MVSYREPTAGLEPATTFPGVLFLQESSTVWATPTLCIISLSYRSQIIKISLVKHRIMIDRLSLFRCSSILCIDHEIPWDIVMQSKVSIRDLAVSFTMISRYLILNNTVFVSQPLRHSRCDNLCLEQRHTYTLVYSDFLSKTELVFDYIYVS